MCRLKCNNFLFKQKTAYVMLRSLVGSEMCMRARNSTQRMSVVNVVVSAFVVVSTCLWSQHLSGKQEHPSIPLAECASNNCTSLA